ncbi:MAG: nicotinamide mononucleotide deamidase-related protein [Candidatus Bathyarchaeota archaeon]|nr:MAG: nicotinamide mononucleotide deamidase-related protein [Candidatus Bathyarchaeota archaeon]
MSAENNEPKKRVEIISIGNELLIGKTPNTNAHWISKRITSLGLTVSLITIVQDEVDEISAVVKAAIARNADFIITTGGLGPTFDDKTLEGIAEAFKSKLHTNEDALKMVEKKYRQYAEEMDREKLELTPARTKMAMIPELAEPLPNPVGTAPGIALKKGKIFLFALPGVPSEMKAIFENSVAPSLKAAGSRFFFETSLYVSGIMESEIAPLIDEVMHDNPYIYIKSHPKGSEKRPKVELHISTIGKETNSAKRRVGRALVQISEVIHAKGGKARIRKAADP